MKLLGATSLLLAASTATAAFSSSRRPSRNRRHLQECIDEAGDAFNEEVLGPSYSIDDSLFKNVLYPNDEFVNIAKLTVNLLYPDYVDTVDGQVTFVQEEQTFGRNGEYTEEFLQQHQQLIDFWKTSEGGRPPILLVGLHSEPLEEQLELAIQYDYIASNGYDPDLLTEESLNATAEQIREAIETELPNGYSNPGLSQEAFFEANFGVAGFEDSSVIVIGDGDLDFGDWLDLNAGNQENVILHAHEFAHAVQFITSVEDDFGGDVDAYNVFFFDESTPEKTREWELEADAMAAYFLAHEQGRNFSVDLLLQAAREGYHTGDCDPTSVGHHGTPDQRECATKWGGDEGLDSMSGEPVTVQEFRALFAASYEAILALDPAACTLSEPPPPSTGSPTAYHPTMAGTALVLVSSLWLLL